MTSSQPRSDGERHSESDHGQIRIGMLWHSLNSGNLGVGALTAANIAIARQCAQDIGLTPHFVVMAMRDGAAAQIVDPTITSYPIDSRTMLSPGGFWTALRSVDCVLDIGAGDSFADIYGPKRFGFLWLTKMMAIASKVPLLLSPQTIGPFTKPVYRLLGSRAMKGAHAVIARDAQSLDVAQQMAPGTPSHLAVDVAFVLPFADRSEERGGAKLRVGINASGLLFHEAETGRNRFGLDHDYAELTRRLIAALLARGDVEVHLVPHATSQHDLTDDDGRLAERLAAEFPGTIRVPDFADASAAKSYISSLDFLVAGRMHACIGAFSAGTPVVPIAYSRKFSGLFGLLDYDWMVPVQGMGTQAAADYILNALDKRAVLAADEARGMGKVKTLLDVYRDALKQMFAQAVDRRR